MKGSKTSGVEECVGNIGAKARGSKKFVGWEAATRCRVYCHRINAEVVALGESFRLIAAERSHIYQTIYRHELNRRRNVTTGNN